MKPPPFSPSAPPGAKAAERLLAWFERHRRDLPWRRTRDPYRIWVSEVMLQQTRVETVIPYYEGFLERFPSLADLAAAEEDEVLARWSGLGYYRRARHLHAAARRIVAEGRGIPRTAARLRALPGFGPYTAAAVASIAFGEAVPVLDGNVIRVICRWIAEAGDPRTAPVRRRLAETATRLLDASRPGDGNQALMELGAIVCTPRRPDCNACPLIPDCRAAESGTMEEFPRRGLTRQATRVRRAVVVVEREREVLLFRRASASRVLGGTWELPRADDCGSETEIAEALETRYGGQWQVGPITGRVRHAITHRSFRVEVRGGEVTSPPEWNEEAPEAGWFRHSQLDELPLSSLVRKALGVAGSPS